MFKAASYLPVVGLLFILPVKAKVPFLIFPPTAPTRTQWIVGIGIPLGDLQFEALTSGFVLKAEYFLPENVTQLRTKTVMPFTRKFGDHFKVDNFLDAPDNVPQKRTNESNEFLNNKQIFVSSYRWTVYKGLEGLANRMGLSGRDCVLKSICEAAATPYHYYNGLFGELLHILLTPSSSADALSSHLDNEYYHAEDLGHAGVDCHRVFKDCARSLLDHFSNVQHLTEGVFKIMEEKLS